MDLECLGNRTYYELKRFSKEPFPEWMAKMVGKVGYQNPHLSDEEITERCKNNTRWLFAALHYAKSQSRHLSKSDGDQKTDKDGDIEMHNVTEEQNPSVSKTNDEEEEKKETETSFDDLFRPFLLHITPRAYFMPIWEENQGKKDWTFLNNISIEPTEWSEQEQKQAKQFMQQFESVRNSASRESQEKSLRTVLNAQVTSQHEPFGDLNGCYPPPYNCLWDKKWHFPRPKSQKKSAQKSSQKEGSTSDDRPPEEKTEEKRAAKIKPKTKPAEKTAETNADDRPQEEKTEEKRAAKTKPKTKPAEQTAETNADDRPPEEKTEEKRAAKTKPKTKPTEQTTDIHADEKSAKKPRGEINIDDITAWKTKLTQLEKDQNHADEKFHDDLIQQQTKFNTKLVEAATKRAREDPQEAKFVADEQKLQAEQEAWEKTWEIKMNTALAQCKKENPDDHDAYNHKKDELDQQRKAARDEKKQSDWNRRQTNIDNARKMLFIKYHAEQTKATIDEWKQLLADQQEDAKQFTESQIAEMQKFKLTCPKPEIDPYELMIIRIRVLHQREPDAESDWYTTFLLLKSLRMGGKGAYVQPRSNGGIPMIYCGILMGNDEFIFARKTTSNDTFFTNSFKIMSLRPELSQ